MKFACTVFSNNLPLALLVRKLLELACYFYNVIVVFGGLKLWNYNNILVIPDRTR